MSGSRQLANFAAKLAKDYGPEQAPLDADPDVVIVPTGSVALDWALRLGGWRQGRIYEIIGVKDAGKSSLVLTGAAIHQRIFPDRGVAYLDIEKTFEPPWATALGVDCSKKARREGRWIHLFPKDSESASDMARDNASSGLVSLIIVDSVGGMESKKAFDKDAAKAQVGSNSQVITRMSKALATLARNNDATILLVNQYRANVGVPMGGDVSAGPKAMQHATTAKVEMAQVFREGATPREAEFYGAKEITGRMSRARVSRMKTGAPSRVAEFWINTQPTEKYGPQGIDSGDEYLQTGLKVGAIQQQPGGYYAMPGGERFHGKDALLSKLRSEQSARDEVRAAIPFEKPSADDDLEELNA